MSTLFKKNKKYDAHCTRRNKGFTLIELLVVIAIVSLLASVVMASLQSGREKAYDAQISGDLSQMRNALELYSVEHGYTYPLVIQLAQGDRVYASKTFMQKISSIFSQRAYAAGRSQNCIYFDNLASVLSPYISEIPRHPLDNGEDVCYKYFASEAGDMAVAYGPSITERYGDGTNKQIGIAVGRDDVESLQSICNENLLSGNFLNGVASPFPLFSGGENHCSGVVADNVLGVASGEGDVSFSYSCSVGGYSSEEECIIDRSYCSDSSYTDQTSCESNGSQEPGSCSEPGYYDEYSCVNASYTSGGGCSDSSYSDEYSCVNAGYSSGGGCSDPNYYDQGSCESAGYSNPGYCSGDSSYTDEYSCVNAGYASGEGCSDGGYYDQSSCENAGYSMGGAYCSDGSYYNESDCWSNGATWYADQWYSYGYTWSSGSWITYGYSWYPGDSVLYGYSWSEPGWSLYGYSWSEPETYLYGYTWTPGQYTNNTWTSVPGGVWGSY